MKPAEESGQTRTRWNLRPGSTTRWSATDKLPGMSAVLQSSEHPSIPPFYLGRQPILDRAGHTVAYELLFRAERDGGASITDDRAATAAVIGHAFSDLGLEAVLGGCQGFINFDAELLLSDVPELLPASSIVIEILETVKFTPRLLERCHELKRLGFRFALDDVTNPDQLTDEVLMLIDIAKIDLGGTLTYRVPVIASQGRAAGIKLLAEKVDSRFQADRCRELGFDLFQGYYFARPDLLEGRRASPDRQALLQLLQHVANGDPQEQIEAGFKRAPELAFKLMRLVNSVGMGVPFRIQSLAHALVVLGERQLHRWLQVLLFANSADGAEALPLLTLAASRGRLMELIAERCGNDPGVRSQAFMTGIVSLLDVLMDVPMDELLRQVNLGYSVQNALLLRAGRLGQMLKLVEALERKDAGDVPTLLCREGKLPLGDLPALQIEAMRWANEVSRASTG